MKKRISMLIAAVALLVALAPATKVSAAALAQLNGDEYLDAVAAQGASVDAEEVITGVKDLGLLIDKRTGYTYYTRNQRAYVTGFYKMTTGEVVYVHNGVYLKNYTGFVKNPNASYEEYVWVVKGNAATGYTGFVPFGNTQVLVVNGVFYPWTGVIRATLNGRVVIAYCVYGRFMPRTGYIDYAGRSFLFVDGVYTPYTGTYGGYRWVRGVMVGRA